MTNEEIAVALRHCAKSGTCQDCPNNPKSEILPRCSVLTDAADIIEKLTTDYDDAMYALEVLNECNDELLKNVLRINETLENVVRYAEKRRDECANDEEWHNVQYWVGYIDGAKRAIEVIDL